MSASFHPLVPLSTRRRTVLIGVLGFLVLLLSQFLRGAGISSPVWSALGVTGIVIMVFGWSRLIFPGFMGLPRLDQADLDERQQIILTSAHATAYRVLAAGLMLVCVYGITVDNFKSMPRLPESGNTLMVVGLIWVVISLPQAILAWTEPDPEGSDRSQ